MVTLSTCKLEIDIISTLQRQPFRAPLLLRLRKIRGEQFFFNCTNSVANFECGRHFGNFTSNMSILVCSIVLCLVQFCVAAKGPSTPHPTYETRYDYLDIDKILGNDRILKRIMDCIMDRGPCTREGKDLKRIIPDALRTNCSKCNDRQKMNVGRALAYLLHYKPEYWFELLNRFDRDGSYRKKLNIDSDDSVENPRGIRRGIRRGRSVPLGVARIERIKSIYA